MQEDIEIRLWNYIDGTCTQEECKRITHLIKTNELWKETYQSLVVYNNTLTKNLNTEKLNSDITSNVMTKIAVTAKPNRAINFYDWITKGIASFFIISIGTKLVFLLSQQDWSWKTNNNLTFLKLKLPQINYSTSLLYSILFVVFFLLLLITEKLINRKAI